MNPAPRNFAASARNSAWCREIDPGPGESSLGRCAAPFTGPRDYTCRLFKLASPNGAVIAR